MVTGFTLLDAKSQVQRLVSGGYNCPKATTVEGVAGVWRSLLKDHVVIDDLEAAVTGYLQDGGRYWPLPAEIRKRALEARSARLTDSKGDLYHEYALWEQGHGDGSSPCPVCGAVLQQTGPKKRYAVVHDAVVHSRARIPHVGLPLSREDEEMYERYMETKSA